MNLLFLPIGIALPTLTGWLLLRILEGHTSVLFRTERWAIGFVLGLTLTMYVTFLTHVCGLISLNFIGFFSVQCLLTLVCGGIWFWNRVPMEGVTAAASPGIPPWIKTLCAVVGAWILLKVSIAGVLLVLSPPYFDDVYNNWNMRGKAFFVEQEIVLNLELGNEIVSSTAVSSYPPTVPMVKAWLASLAGTWDEGLVNSIHLLWYCSALVLLFFALRRYVNVLWSALGTYLLASLPLYLMHGANAYADVFLSVHLFLALSMILHVLRAEGDAQKAFIRIAALALGLLIFTKNEAILLYLPPLVLILIISLVRNRSLPLKSMILWYTLAILAVLVPWVLYKVSHGLTFGNAKEVTGMTLGWQPGVVRAVWINTFFEGNWLLLFAVFIGLLIARAKQAFRSVLVVLTGFILIVYFGQLFLFLFTSLSQEALRQTGYARGLLHLVPCIVFLIVLLLQPVFSKQEDTIIME